VTARIVRTLLLVPGCALLLLAVGSGPAVAAPADSAWVPAPGSTSPPPASHGSAQAPTPVPAPIPSDSLAPPPPAPALTTAPRDSMVSDSVAGVREGAALDTLAAARDTIAAPADSIAAPRDSVTTPPEVVPPASRPQPTAPPRSAGPAARPRVGLALSGGGARGAAHIGLLQVLEENRIPVDYVAGTSMGAVIGGLYASGLSPARMDTIATDLDWLEAFTDKSRRADRTFIRKRDDDGFLMRTRAGFRRGKVLLPPATLDGHLIDLLLKRLTLPVVSVRHFDDLGIPFRAVTTDLLTGETVVLREGDLAQAMRASMAVPGAFATREVDGRLLVDGGITNVLPIDVVRRMGADVVIAMDIAPPAKDREDLQSLPDLTFHLAVLSAERNRRQQIESLGDSDVFLKPDLGSITLVSFDRTADAIVVGRQAAQAVVADLLPFALPPEAYRAWQEARAAKIPAPDSLVIAAVEVESESRVDNELLRQRLDVPTHVPLDVQRLERGVRRLAGLELFGSTSYDVEQAPEGNVLRVTATPRAWGPDYLQAGIGVFDDYAHPNVNLALAYTRTAINRLNGEWAAGVQLGQEPGVWGRFHQPLDERLRWFADGRVLYTEWALGDFDANGHQRAEYGLRQFGVVLSGGRAIGPWAEGRAGIVRLGGDIRQQTGTPGESSRSIDTGELYAEFFADALDGMAFPSEGFLLRGRLAAGLDALGSAEDYQQMYAEGTLVRTFKRFTGLAGGSLGITLDGDAPLESRFRIGGLGRVSGLQQDEKIGQHAVLLRGMVYQRVLKLWPVYGGVSVEVGGVFQSREDVSFEAALPAAALFAGVQTPLGPVTLAYGVAEGGRDNFYLTLGQIIGLPHPGLRPH
jgi:NTE family protein